MAVNLFDWLLILECFILKEIVKPFLYKELVLVVIFVLQNFTIIQLKKPFEQMEQKQI